MADPATSARAVYARDLNWYFDRAINPAERALLARLYDRWHRLSMLDIGVGAGRTAFTFGAVAGRYLGIDYTPAMVEASRQLVGEDDRTEFRVWDARELRSLGESFDVALFSYNGIDTLAHEDRLRVLGEVRAVLRDDSLFLFSSHSLAGLRRHLSVRPVGFERSLRSAYQLARGSRHSLRLLRVGRRLDWTRMESQGWGMVRDGTHRFDLEMYHVTPREQARQLRDAGLELLEVMDADGHPVTIDYEGQSRWLHFLCRPATSTSR